MIGIVTTMYLLFDGFGTATNVAGNGTFAIIFNKLYEANIIKKFSKTVLISGNFSQDI
jgi:Na+/H+-dicarboxylate symporter